MTNCNLQNEWFCLSTFGFGVEYETPRRKVVWPPLLSLCSTQCVLSYKTGFNSVGSPTLIWLADTVAIGYNIFFLCVCFKTYKLSFKKFCFLIFLWYFKQISLSFYCSCSYFCFVRWIDLVMELVLYGFMKQLLKLFLQFLIPTCK